MKSYRVRLSRAPWLVLLGGLAACVSIPRGSLQPTGERVTRGRPSFAGQYCFAGVGRNARDSGNGSLNRPIPVSQLREGSIVTVDHLPDQRIEFGFIDQAGDARRASIDLTQPGALWDDGRLRVDLARQPWGASGMGVGSQSRSAVMYRMADGRLVLESSMSETGLAFGVLPMYEKQAAVLELAPVGDGPCAADTSAPDPRGERMRIPGSYELTICRSVCRPGDTRGTPPAGTLVLAADAGIEGANGCFVVGADAPPPDVLTGIPRTVLLRWRFDSLSPVVPRVRFELHTSSSAGYNVSVFATYGGLTGVGSRRPLLDDGTPNRERENVAARRIGEANVALCTPG